MAEEENVAELRDIASELKAAFEAAANSADKMNRSFQSSKRELLNLDEVFRELLHVSDEFPGNITKASQLQKAIVEDGRLFVKTQEASLRLFKQIAKDGWEAQVKHMQEASGLSFEQLVNTEEYEAELQKHNKLTEKNTSLLNRNFEILKKQALARKMDSLVLGNITDAIDDLGAKIRSPNLAFASMLKKIGSLPGGIFNAAKNSKNLGETLIKLINPALGKTNSLAKILFSPTGLLIAGVAAASAAVTILYKLIANLWSFMDEKAIPAAAAFNREIGAMSENAKVLRSETVSTGVQFEMLGKSFMEGVQFMNDFVKGLASTSAASKTAIQLGKELTLVVGMTAQESGKLVMQFQKQNKTLEDVRDMFGVAERSARAYGLPVNEVLRDLGRFPGILARFGTKNRQEFAKSVAQARSYGLEIGKINDAFGDQLDTFEGSSEAAAKLNAMFGTAINSYDLMLETNPQKRMEMLRRSLIDQGHEWEKLSVFQKNVIASTLGVDKETAALVLSSDDERKSLERKAREKEKDIKLNERWEKSLGQIKETLIAWKPLLDQLMRKITDFIGRIVGIDSQGGIMSFAQKIEAMFERLGNFFDTFEMRHPATFKLLQLLTGADISKIGGPGLIGAKTVDQALNQGYREVQGPNGTPMYLPPEPKDMDLIPIAPQSSTKSAPRSVEMDFSRPENKKGTEKVEFVAAPIYLDGRRLGEYQVKISRGGN